MNSDFFEVVGTKKFGPEIDITDPCYNKKVWCRLNNVKIKEGEYRCIVWIKKTHYDDYHGNRHYDTRIAKIGIYYGDIPHAEKLKEIGDIGVDAGLAGFFNNKPDYNDEEWSELCSAIKGKDYLINEEGFFSSSGYGDGYYPVYAEKDTNGEITSLEIAFM